MRFMLRATLSSFFAGAAAASGLGFYFLHKDYMIAQEAISQQVAGWPSKTCQPITDVYQVMGTYDSLDSRLTTLENLKKLEITVELGVPE